jgi:hypothetical protein
VPGELKRWDPRIRRFLFESELLSSLYFAADIAPGGASGTEQWATLWSLNETGGATGQNAPAGTWSKFVSMNRPTHSILQQQLNLVNGYSDLRADRAREIVAQMTPQYAFWSSVVPLYGGRHRRTLELIQIVLRLAKVRRNELRYRALRATPARTVTTDPDDHPDLIHGSLPSGH